MDYVPTAEKGAPSGVATLDVASKIPTSQLPDLAPIIAPSVESKLDRDEAATIYVAKTEDAFRVSRADLVEGADNRDAIQAVINAAAASGIRHVILPAGEITLGRQLTIPSGAHNLIIEGHGDDTTIRQVSGAVNKALFYGAGTDGTKAALTSDAAAGSGNVEVPAAVASTLSPGAILGLECQTLVYGIGVPGFEVYASELRKVVSVSGTTVTLDSVLLHSYQVSTGAVAWKMDALSGVQVRNMTITSTDPLAIRGRAIMFEKARNVRVTGIRIRDAGGGIFAMDTMDSYFADISVENLPNVGNYFGYGLTVGGRSAHAYVEGLRGRNFRHLFTTLADERKGTLSNTQWGGPRHVTIRGGAGEQQSSGTQYSVWDTHPCGYDIVFDQCRAFGGSGPSSNGFQIRSKNTRLINPVAMHSGNLGIRIDPTTSGEIEIVGGEVAASGAGGVSLARNTSIRGVWIHDNKLSGVSFTDTASGSRISDNRIENNQYGIHDQSSGAAKGVIVQGNSIPKSAAQSLALVSPKSNLAYVHNVVPGYGPGHDGIGGSPATTIKKAGNITD
ncbi:right-handed parallel beta-helix repeat-containing protein [Arthrobacter nitrophenolicus]|uniref:Uncharacterized protein n=2 Tax=Arthrobacter nitrophenolicus TaxID=683150 RepID=A0ACC6TDL8_9MICC|nr:right-handed parallel beta-helix repeat-containing protein [Arthrobacter nitrophenolicus]ELT45958.1 hypothetical protein G205_01888 [Arthrobacter nitrophenolicus]